MARLTLLGAAAALVLAVAAFYESQAIAGEYDNCYTPAAQCTGTCSLGTCVPQSSALPPLSCNGGDMSGYRPAQNACGSCMLHNTIPTGDVCGPPFAAEPC